MTSFLLVSNQGIFRAHTRLMVTNEGYNVDSLYLHTACQCASIRRETQPIWCPFLLTYRLLNLDSTRSAHITTPRTRHFRALRPGPVRRSEEHKPYFRVSIPPRSTPRLWLPESVCVWVWWIKGACPHPIIQKPISLFLIRSAYAINLA